MLTTNKSIIAACLTLWSFSIAPAHAGDLHANILTVNTSVASYTPAPRPKPQRTEGGGSRGCINAPSLTLQLLAPKDHTAFTVSAYPTLSWYISELPKLPLEISLVEEGVAQPVLVKQLDVKNAGLMQFQLPKETSGLEIGKQYRWTVSLICNSERPSQSFYARAWIERTSIPSESAKNISRLSAYDKALAYIQAGIWYDAITSISDSYSVDKNLDMAASLLQSLLQQVGLKEAIAIKLL
ncbi:DUF928 domain-containing protein [Pseudanabaena biceps]|nr:DUF928 domain-containing protein [Pseudanabaena biceps]